MRASTPIVAGMAPYRLVLSMIAALAAAPATDAATLCGTSIREWCTKPGDGRCGRHGTESECRADPDCVAMRYSGESLVACHWDARGFADNCPAVGCRDR